MVSINIHVQPQSSEREYKSCIAIAERMPVTLTFTPATIKKIPKDVLAEFKELLSHGKHHTLGQRGNKGYCGFCVRYYKNNAAEQANKGYGFEPFHENFCPWKGYIPKITQVNEINEGKRILRDVFERTPIVYLPPAYLYDKHTLIAAHRCGFGLLCDGNYTGDVNPYRTKLNMVILPQVILTPQNLKQLGRVGGIYLKSRHILGLDLEDLIKSFEKSVESIEEVKPEPQDIESIKKNRRTKIQTWLVRNFIDGLEIKEDSAFRLTKAYIESKEELENLL